MTDEPSVLVTPEPSKKSSPDLLGYGFASLVIVGGLLGFRKGSKVSLEAGLLGGAAAGYAAHQVSNDTSKAFIGTGVCTTLSLIMAYRWFNTKNHDSEKLHFDICRSSCRLDL